MLNLHKFDQDVLETEVRPLFENTVTGGLSNIFAAILIYFLLIDNHQASLAMIISSSIIIFSIVRIYFSNIYLKLNDPNELGSHLKIHFAMTLLVGACWGAFAFIQQHQQDPMITNIVFLMNFGLMAASIATLAFWIPTYLAYIMPQALAVFSVFIADGANHSYLMAFSFVIVNAILISTCITVNRNQRQNLILTRRNQELISNLSDEVENRILIQDLLEESKRDLENKVDERTSELTKKNEELKNEIIEKQQIEINLEYIAYHDELTGLPNKSLLVDRIDQSIEMANRYGNSIGILFLDLDRFKNINDSLGHNIGDKLIREVARRLQDTIRKEDTLCRNGGDEFVIVIQRMTSSDEAIIVAKKIIDKLTNIFEIDSHKVHVGASIGISLYPNDGGSSLELIRNADTAMYKAKLAGGNRLQFYDQSMSAQLRSRLNLENELHIALEKDEFYMVYQPQIDCSTGSTKGFEALIRWNNQRFGETSPDEFVPLLEETGLIYSVGEWVITEVADFIRRNNIVDQSISINLSTLQCKDINLIIHIQNEIKRTGIKASQLEFEITETLLINDFDKTEIFLNELHDLGCTIALDDFGTGYTSMGYLTRLPIDIIKVDKSFIRGIDSSSTLFNIVKAIVKMSDGLGIVNIFEGVETEAELDMVKLLNGRFVQGYLYSKPLEEAVVEDWLSRHNNSHLRVI